MYWPFIVTGIAASLLLVLIYSPFNKDWEAPDTPLSDNRSEPEPSRNPQDLYPLDSSAVLLKENASIAANRNEEIRSERNITRSQHGIVEDTKNSDPSRETYPNVIQKLPSPIPDEQPKVEFPLNETNQHITEALDAESTSSPSLSMEQYEALARVNEWLAESGSSLSVIPEKVRAGPLKLGVMVSPQASSNASGGMNLGAGVMSEFSLTKRLKLDVGVNYARQRMMPDRSPNMVVEMATYASSSQRTDMQNIRTSSNYIGSELLLNFASLDIPVNLKYRVMERKSTGLYLITGLSSMVYLDQQATETFQTNSFFTNSAEGLSFAPSVQKFTSVYSPEGGKNSVDVGGMLNLSVGYEYTLNDGMFISFEPFYKLPLGNLTFADQQFSIGGLNLRMNFNLRK